MVKGGMYLSIVNIFSQFLSITLNLILARLLRPEDFGLMALANTYLGFIGVITAIGFGSSIIQKKDPSDLQISSIYWMNMALSALTFLIIVGSSGWAASFYEAPELASVIWVASSAVVMTPFFIIHYKLKEKDLEFRLLSRITMISTTTGALAAIISAFAGLSVYALVMQVVVGTFLKMVLTLKFSNFKPRWVFNYKEIHQMVMYSIKFKASRILLYTDRNIDYLILGKVFTSVILGYYSFAYNVMYTPVKRISYIFNDVLFPTLSSLQGNKDKVIKGYFRSVELIAMISFPLMTIAALHTEVLVNFLFGNKWDGAVPIVKILCYAGAIQSISQLGSVVFNSIGKPEVDVYFGIIRTALTVVAIIGGALYGVEPVAWFLLVTKLVSFIVILFVMHHQIPYKPSLFLNSIKKAVLVLVLLNINMLAISPFALGAWWNLFISVILAFGLTLFLNLRLIREIAGILLPKKLKEKIGLSD